MHCEGGRSVIRRGYGQGGADAREKAKRIFTHKAGLFIYYQKMGKIYGKLLKMNISLFFIKRG
jgi:hypothetical protein